MLKETLFKSLVKKYKANVYGFARYLLSDETEAEDATQEVMIKLWNNFGSINPVAYKSWILTTTYNFCIDVRRKRKVHELMDYIDESDFDIFEFNQSESPAQTGENNELGELISQKISRLPETQRSVFVLYQIEGFKYREIAKITGIPVNSVKVNLLRARKKLQFLLKDVYEGRQAI